MDLGWLLIWFLFFIAKLFKILPFFCRFGLSTFDQCIHIKTFPATLQVSTICINVVNLPIYKKVISIGGRGFYFRALAIKTKMIMLEWDACYSGLQNDHSNWVSRRDLVNTWLPINSIKWWLTIFMTAIFVSWFEKIFRSVSYFLRRHERHEY